MSTTKNLIDRALTRIGVLDSDAEATGSEIQDSLQVCNEMLEQWSIEGLMIPAGTYETFTAVAALGNMFTMGSGGDLDTVRPISIVDINGISAAGTDYDIQKATSTIWLNINVRNETARPRWWYAEMANPLVQIRFDTVPLPTESLRILSYKPLGDMPALTSENTFPPGYDRAIRLNLEIELSGEFNMPVNPDTVVLADKAKKTIKRMNKQARTLKMDSSMVRPIRYDINAYPT